MQEVWGGMGEVLASEAAWEEVERAEGWKEEEEP